MTTHFRLRTIALATTATVALAGCSLLGSDDETKSDEVKRGESLEGTTVVLATHESFALPEELIASFKEKTGITLKVRPSGDAGELSTKLVLSKSKPFADVAFGIDNTFATRAVSEGVFAAYEPKLPAGAESLELDGDAADVLTPIDHASVCVNVDDAWFAKNDRLAPQNLDDLADPAFKDLLILPGATTSSPGLAFLLATIAEYGEDGWVDYWTRLMDNGAKLADGWTEAYSAGFTGAGKGDRPIVVSYDTSPAFTLDEKSGDSTTSALLNTCFRQVEYAGVLTNAKNPGAAEKVVDFLLSPEVQAVIPENMYVFPADSEVRLPTEWAKFAKPAADPLVVSADDIDEHRQAWLTEWTDVVTR
ncbi:thiamine ABC transporter substrate binding subunit [Nocardioides sp. Bht2]|uniref:thiamine ABC transporter substrate-binding protein n=1 Tax=Nocardioides sp. Bht2 TaxID=3392297 RepID=UPI0039B6B67E